MTKAWIYHIKIKTVIEPKALFKKKYSCTNIKRIEIINEYQKFNWLGK